MHFAQLLYVNFFFNFKKKSRRITLKVLMVLISGWWKCRLDLLCRVVYLYFLFSTIQKYSFCNNKRLVFKLHSKYKIVLFMQSGGGCTCCIIPKGERGVATQITKE